MKAFKFACPVCGQHINADSDHTGSQLECPTCYQQLIVPQAPASDDPKFIISAAQVRKARPNGLPEEPQAVVIQPRKAPWMAIVAGLLLLCGVATAFVFHDSIFGNKKADAPVAADDKPTPVATPTPAPVPAPLPVVADARWNLDVSEMAFPDAPAVGKIHGEDFVCERAYLQGGVLTLRTGTNTADLSINITLAKAGEQMGLHYAANTSTVPAPKVTLRWRKTDSSTASLSYTGGYGLKLDMENVVNNKLPGKIYICTPDDQKSFVCGSFVAEIKKPKAPKK